MAISAVTSRAQASAKATVRRGRSYWPDKRMAAVESVVIVLEPSGDFSKALAKLESKVKIHGALKRGFSSIYGFTSDQEGIRHALLEAGAPAVDETDSLFMIGACAAFVSYLINKSRNAGLLASKRTAQ